MKKYNVVVNGETFTVEVEEVGGAATSVASAPKAAPAPAAAAPAPAPKAAPAPAAAPAVTADGCKIESPLPGTILKINVTMGQAIKAGDVLLILEAMKMENEIVAPQDGSVKAISVAAGKTVQAGDVLLVI